VAIIGISANSSFRIGSELATVLGGAKLLELDVDWIERVVLARLADRGVDDLLAVPPAFGAVLGRQVDV
jgi:hypothetical protein